MGRIKIGLLAVLLLGVMGVGAYGFSQEAGGSKGSGGISHRAIFSGQPITWMIQFKDRLGLTETQVSELEKLRADFEGAARQAQQEMIQQQDEIMALVEGGSADLATIEAKIRQAERRRADLQIQRIRSILQAQALLTPEQREKCEKLMTTASSEPGREVPGGAPVDHCDEEDLQPAGPDRA